VAVPDASGNSEQGPRQVLQESRSSRGLGG